MNTTLKLAILAALGVAGPLLSQKSAALDAAAPSDNDTLTTIVVTAEKREEVLQNVPMSVTALGGESLDKLQDRDFSEYAAMVPGLSLVTSQPGLTRLTLRGQNAGGVGSTVAVYLDESPFGSSSALLNGSILSGDFDTWDLQRIEVLRGPQGTLYGANSEGGLLKFVTTPPELGKFSGAAEVTGESVAHGGSGGDIRAVVNLPLGDKMAFRISGFDQDVPGYINDPSRGKSDLNDGHKEGGRASLLAVPTDDLTIRLTATSQQSKYDGTPAIDVDPVTLKPLHGDLTQERNVSEPSSFKYENYNATINWNAGPFSILSTTSYGILNSDTFTDASNQLLAPGLTVQDLLGLLVGPNLGASLDDLVDMKKFTQEIRLSSPASDRLEWQVGGYYTHETGALNEHLNAIDIPGGAPAGLPSLEIPIIASTYKEWAGFGNLTYHFNPQFDIQAGGRYSSNKQTDAESATGLLVPTPANLQCGFERPRVHVFRGAAMACRRQHHGVCARRDGLSPGWSQCIAARSRRPACRASTVQTKPPTSNSASDRHSSTGCCPSMSRLSTSIGKTFSSCEAIGGFNINGNGGKARSQGLEWTFGYIPVHGLTFNWTGAYTDAKLTSDAPARRRHFRRTRCPTPRSGAPRSTANTTGPAFANYKGFVGATWSYVGTRSTDFGSSAAHRSGAGRAWTATIPSRPASASTTSRYRVTLYGKNLGDSRGITSYVSSGAPGLAGDITVIQPRTVGVTLSAKF